MWPYSSSYDFGDFGEPEVGNGVMPHGAAGERRFWLAGGFPEFHPRGRPATPLLRLHVIPIEGGGGGAFEPPGLSALGELGGLGAPWLLGQTLASSLDRELAGAIRHGAVFFDSGGRLFERRGPTLVPLTEPGRGTHRRVIDLEPDEVRVTDAEGRDRNGATERASGVGVRALLPDPGQWRVVRWSDFRKPLGSQLARPERLSDGHRLPCFVQVFEATAPQSREMFARRVLGDAGSPAELPRLTRALAARLGLVSLHRGRPGSARPAGEPDTVVLPGDRFVHVRLAFDPTAHSGDDERAPGTPAGRPGPRARAGAPRPRRAPGVGEAPAEEMPDARPRPRGAGPGRDWVEPLGPETVEDRIDPNGRAPGGVALGGVEPGQPGGWRREIPSRFLVPWELRRSREEALYDLQRAAAQNPLARFTGWVRRRLGRRERIRKWQMMLAGKSYDDQLWLVRPPRHGLSDPLVLDWAERCLALAGYDPLAMLDEWEIYWRRKGL